MLAYCVSCRKMMEMKNPKAYTMKNGRSAFKGLDFKGHKLNKIGSKK